MVIENGLGQTPEADFSGLKVFFRRVTSTLAYLLSDTMLILRAFETWFHRIVLETML